MTQAIVDPEQLRRFGVDIRHFSHDVDDSIRRLQAQLDGLEHTWRDQEYLKFRESFQRIVLAFHPFLRDADDFANWLDRKAEPIEDYLSR
jgi:hypothetical protein